MTRDPPTCPECGKTALVTPTRYGNRYSCCGLWSWDAKPLADARTHAARQAAHAAFDKLWKVEGYSRSRCYRALSDVLGLPGEDCHMASMTAEVAERVPGAVERVRRLLAKEPRKPRPKHRKGRNPCSRSSLPPPTSPSSTAPSRLRPRAPSSSSEPTFDDPFAPLTW